MAHRSSASYVVVFVMAFLAAVAALAGFAGTDVFLPMVGRQAGVYPSNWYTTVWVYNPGAAVATARLYFLERGTANPTPPYVDVLVAPSDTERLDNVVETYFHVQKFGAIRVTCDSQKLVVTSRVFSKGPGGADRDSAGQDFAAVPATFAIGSGESTRILGVWQTSADTAESDFRYNFGAVETTGHSASVKFTAFDGNNQQLGTTTVGVSAFSQGQWVYKDRFPSGLVDNARLEAQVVSGTGRVIVYGSQIANGSQDPTTFEMQYKDSLLGIANVQHDATLKGDGTAGAPLGIADNGVTAAQLPAQVITADKLADEAVTVHKLATVPSPPTTAPEGSSVSAMRADPLEQFFKVGDSMFWGPAYTGDITAVNTAAGSGLTGGVAAGDANLAIAPLGVTQAMLADGSVTPAKVSTAGAAAGSVLKFDGSAVTWGPDALGGLSLPWAGSSTVDPGPIGIFAVEEAATGTAIYAKSKNGTAIRAQTDDGSAAIYGHCAPCAAVVGESESKEGVVGRSTSSTGVSGETATGVGVLGASQGGIAVQGRNEGLTGNAARFEIENPASAGSALYARTTGSGSASEFEVSYAKNSSAAVLARTYGTGPAVLGTNEHAGTAGHLGQDGAGVVGEGAGGSVGYLGSGTAGAYGKQCTHCPEGFLGTADAGVKGTAGGIYGVYGASVLNWGAVGFIGMGPWPRGAVFGLDNESNAIGYLAGAGAGAFGRSGTGFEGYLGHYDSGAWGMDSTSGNLGYLGSASFGAFGQNASGTIYGYLNNGSNGAGGRNGDNWGRLGTPSYAGEFNGTVRVSTLAGTGNRTVYATSTGVLTNSSSDVRLKRDIAPLAEDVDVLAALATLRGVKFNWDPAVERAKHLGEQREIGMIAQEVETVLPELVGVDQDGYETLDYAKLSAFLVEVAKAQQAQLRAQAALIEAQDVRLRALEHQARRRLEP